VAGGASLVGTVVVVVVSAGPSCAIATGETARVIRALASTAPVTRPWDFFNKVDSHEWQRTKTPSVRFTRGQLPHSGDGESLPEDRSKWVIKFQ
jgi:hypothetical protein